MSEVVITHNANIDLAISEALRASKLENLIRDKIVAVKPNETWASEEDLTAVTQAETLRSVLKFIKNLGPKELYVSGGAGAAETEDVFKLSGMMKVIEEEKAKFFDHNKPPFTTVDLSYEPSRDVMGPQESVVVNPKVLEYETLISLSQMKVHSTATVTLALKNIAMSYPAADYYGHPRSDERHEHKFFADMHSFIAAMARRFKIDFAINVGHPAMIWTGPIGGITRNTGLVVASKDALSADVVSANILGFDFQAVRHLWEAANLDIGEADISKMQFPLLSIDDATSLFKRAFIS